MTLLTIGHIEPAFYFGAICGVVSVFLIIAAVIIIGEPENKK
jgi:hypothetical protein